MDTLPTTRDSCGIYGAVWPALLGGLGWIGTLLLLRPHPFTFLWITVFLLLAPLVLVPLGLRLLQAETRHAGEARLWRRIVIGQLPAAVVFGWAFVLPAGGLAALLTLPWLATTSTMAMLGLWRIWQRGLTPLHALCRDVSCLYLVVGSAWATLERLGAYPLGFAGIVVVLTAVHFHYAGFVLPLVTGLALRHVGGRSTQVAGSGVIAGVPLVAMGITATQWQLGWGLECVAASVMGGAGLLVAWLHLRLALQRRWGLGVRCLWAITALALGTGMVLALLYGMRFFLPLPWLTIPWMQAVHGASNAVGFGLASVSAWNLALARPTPPGQHP